MTVSIQWETVEGRQHAFYVVPLTEDELRSLAYVADRYASAEVLYDRSAYDSDTETLRVPEHVAWQYVAALSEDNGVEDAFLPPLAGGTLADALSELWEAIV